MNRTQKPERCGADRGSDSDRLPGRIKARVETNCALSEENQQLRYEAGRKRCKRRWIEPTQAWLSRLRRLLIRHQHLFPTYRAFLYLVCLWIMLRHCS